MIPAVRSRRRSNASSPSTRAPTANTSQFWNAYRSTGVPIAHRHARGPKRRASSQVMPSVAKLDSTAMTASVPKGPEPIDTAAPSRSPASTGYSSTRST